MNAEDRIDIAIRHARHYYPFAFRMFREDARQAATLGALMADESPASIRRETGRQMRTLMTELLGRREDSPGDIIRRRSLRSARRWTAQRLRAIGLGSADIAAQTGLTAGTINKITTSARTPEDVRRLRSEGGRKGGKLGAIARWGSGYESRRIKARALRATGSKLRQIQAACGYKSLSAAHYAVKGSK